MTYNIISTGSKGNAVVIGGSLLVDCGVPYRKLESIRQDLKLVLLTHRHTDHINAATVRRLASDRPTLRWACCEWMVSLLDGLVEPRNIDIAEPGAWLDYGAARVSPVPLTHNVPNCGWRIEMGSKRAFYATDTGTLGGITALGYDLYLIEANHGKDELLARARAKLERGEFSHEMAAAHNHMSREDAEDWLYQNIGQDGRYVFLHQHEGD